MYGWRSRVYADLPTFSGFYDSFLVIKGFSGCSDKPLAVGIIDGIFASDSQNDTVCPKYSCHLGR
jgi:hypothetical protein